MADPQATRLVAPDWALAHLAVPILKADQAITVDIRVRSRVRGASVYTCSWWSCGWTLLPPTRIRFQASYRMARAHSADCAQKSHWRSSAAAR